MYFNIYVVDQRNSNIYTSHSLVRRKKTNWKRKKTKRIETISIKNVFQCSGLKKFKHIYMEKKLNRLYIWHSKEDKRYTKLRLVLKKKKTMLPKSNIVFFTPIMQFPDRRNILFFYQANLSLYFKSAALYFVNRLLFRCY